MNACCSIAEQLGFCIKSTKLIMLKKTLANIARVFRRTVYFTNTYNTIYYCITSFLI